MGSWSLLFLGVLTVALVIATQEVAGEEEDKPCLSWSCARKRALKLAANPRPNESRREMLLRKLYDASRADNEMKKSSEEETPCMSWSCRRKRRDLKPPTDRLPTDDTACLTEDCRVGRTSILGTDSAALMRKLRFSRESKKSDPGCLAFHCQGKRDGMEAENEQNDFSES